MALILVGLTLALILVGLTLALIPVGLTLALVLVGLTLALILVGLTLAQWFQRRGFSNYFCQNWPDLHIFTKTHYVSTKPGHITYIFIKMELLFII